MTFADAAQAASLFVRKSMDAPYLEFVVGVVLINAYVVAPWFKAVSFEHVTAQGLWPIAVALVGMKVADALKSHKTNLRQGYGGQENGAG